MNDIKAYIIYFPKVKIEKNPNVVIFQDNKTNSFLVDYEHKSDIHAF